MFLDGVERFDAGGRPVDGFTVRTCNDDPCFAPSGHAVVQAIVPTDYEWWSTRGTRYAVEKEGVAERIATALDVVVPRFGSLIRMTDVATPLTYWTTARSWRGAYEGWTPSAEGIFGHVRKTLKGLDGFYMAGQWVEPGGGVPVAVLSGRQVVQLLCHVERRPFVPVSMELSHV